MAHSPKKLAIVIPAHNESLTIGGVLQEIQSIELPAIQKEIVVVDDGSTDETAKVAQSKGAVVVRHLVNRGLGGALGTGILAAIRRGADLVVTFDADGQHRPEDIPEIIQPILRREGDVAIGSRMMDTGGMPRMRQIANHLANFITFLLFGVRTTDSQSGLRAFSRAAAEKIRITANNYEVSSEIFREIRRHHLKLVEVPIQSIYSEYSLSKGQGFRMGIRTLLRLLLYKDMR